MAGRRSRDRVRRALSANQHAASAIWTPYFCCAPETPAHLDGHFEGVFADALVDAAQGQHVVAVTAGADELCWIGRGGELAGS